MTGISNFQFEPTYSQIGDKLPEIVNLFGSLFPEWYVPHTHTSACYKTVYNKPCNHVINAHDHTDSCKNGCNGELNAHSCLRAGCVKRVLVCGYD